MNVNQEDIAYKADHTFLAKKEVIVILRKQHHALNAGKEHIINTQEVRHLSPVLNVL